MRFSTDYWKKTESHIEFITATSLPDGVPVTAVKLISIVDNQILLVHTPKGWDIPGGHVEAEEAVDDALRREIAEETGGTLDQHSLVGYLKITNKVENSYNKHYPQVSCIAIYNGLVYSVSKDDELFYEATAARYFPLSNLPEGIADWSRLSVEIIDYTNSLGE